MDIDTPSIPVSYDEFRDRLRAFIAANLPTLGWKPGVGLRVPDDPEDVAALRRWVRQLHDAGFVMPMHGLGTSDPFEARILREELGRTGIPSVLGNPLVATALSSFGTEAQQAEYLPRIATGEHIWTQLFSEPGAGSDLASLSTRAVLDGDHYRVTGQKVWSTWAQFADFGYLLARSEDVPGSKGITAFILDMHSDGVTTRPLREITGTTDFNEVFLDDVRVPAANVIGVPGQGWAVAQLSLVSERSAVSGGSGRDPISALVRIARQADPAGVRRIDDPAVRRDIARLAVRARIQRYLGYAVATRAASKVMAFADAPMLKIWASELGLDLADYAMQLEGAAGVLTEGDPLAVDDGTWQDAFLYARALTIAGGSNEIMRNLIAERGLGLPREPRG
jgi:alkylation response protein AidB-like acyl-CoA dehydrogenase